MQQDKKLGLALGVLLIGAVAAFFFRQDPTALSGAPELADAERIDAQVDERPLAPYRSPDRSGVGLPQPSAADPFSEVSHSGGPFRDEPAEWELRLPSDSRVSDRMPTVPVVPDPVLDFEQHTGPETYTVKPGDTLSGIALKLLGRSSRYNELYTANKHIMRSADDLRVGMRLKVPGDTQASSDEVNRSQAVTATPREPVQRVQPQPTGVGHSAAFVERGGRGERAAIDDRDMSDAEAPVRFRRRGTYQPDSSATGETQPTPKTFESDPAPVANVPPGAEEVSQSDPNADYHRVLPGDSLERIAILHYGSRQAVRRIYEANQERINRPDRLEVGTMLKLPRY